MWIILLKTSGVVWPFQLITYPFLPLDIIELYLSPCLHTKSTDKSCGARYAYPSRKTKIIPAHLCSLCSFICFLCCNIHTVVFIMIIFCFCYCIVSFFYINIVSFVIPWISSVSFLMPSGQILNDKIPTNYELGNA